MLLSKDGRDFARRKSSLSLFLFFLLPFLSPSLRPKSPKTLSGHEWRGKGRLFGRKCYFEVKERGNAVTGFFVPFFSSFEMEETETRTTRPENSYHLSTALTHLPLLISLSLSLLFLPLAPLSLSLSSSSLSLFLARSPVSTTSAFFSSYTFKPSTQQPRCPSCEVSRTRVSFVRVARIRWGRGRVRGRDKETTLNLGPGSKTATECGGRGRG